MVLYFQALQSFLESLNTEMLKSGLPPVSTITALKFLMARKFDVNRASKLFKQHLEVRAKYKLSEMKPLDEPLSKELLSEKLTILVSLALVPVTCLGPAMAYQVKPKENKSQFCECASVFSLHLF